MLQSERLRKALCQFHFRRCEAQIRRELCALLKILPEAIRFVEWDQHDLIVEQVEKYRAEARGGGYPTSGREWNIEEWNQVQEAITLLAYKMDDNPAYFYIPQYVVSFVSYIQRI